MRPIRLGYFTALSAIGWCIDFAVFNCLVYSGLSDILSNLISATIAVTFVFITSRRWIFRNHVESLGPTVTKYVIWNIFAVIAASLLVRFFSVMLGSFPEVVFRETVGQLTGLSISARMLSAITAKLLVTPFTMYANFVVMGYIIERRLSLV